MEPIAGITFRQACRLLPGSALLVLVLAGCSDVTHPTSPDPGPPAREIVDGSQGGGNPAFHFLPPLAPSASYSGRFDPTLAPNVEICEWSGASCGALLASFSTTSGSGSEILRVDPVEEHYIVNWRTDRHALTVDQGYRIQVLLAGRELGHADVEVSSSGRGFRNANTGEAISLVGGSTLAIRFRIEEGALPVGGGPIIATGLVHSCGLVNGAGWCWGTAGNGRLGTGTAEDLLSPGPVVGGHDFSAVVAGGGHSCGLATDGSAWCWGFNGFGALGIGSPSEDKPTPHPVAGGHRFTTLGSGNHHACGLTSAGELYCWGWNDDGQIGDGSQSTAYAPVRVSGTYTSFALGAVHTCAIETTGGARCWGRNAEGQLGTGSTSSPGLFSPQAVVGEPTFVRLGAGAFHTCGISGEGRAYCWGRNGHGQLGIGSTDEAIATPQPVAGDLVFTRLAGGNTHTCGITVSGEGYCWGSNDEGQLGTGAFGGLSSTPLAIAGGHAWTELDGKSHTCGVTTQGAGFCWGPNWLGQLGTGASDSRSQPTAIAGGHVFGS